MARYVCGGGYVSVFSVDGEADGDAAGNAAAYDGTAAGNGKRTFLLVVRVLLHSCCTPVGSVSVFVCGIGK